MVTLSGTKSADETVVEVVDVEGADSNKLSFSDVAQQLQIGEGDVVLDESTVAYYYRHRTTRDFRFGEWHFTEFLLTVRSEEENQRFIRDYTTMPSEEQVQIVEYHPDIAAQVESQVGGVRKSPETVRGAVGTQNFKDPKLLSPAKPN